MRHKHIADEMLHDTCVNKLRWAFAESMSHAAVWTGTRIFEVKLVCKETGNH